MGKINSHKHLVYWILWTTVISFADEVIVSFALPAYSPLQNLLFMIGISIMVTALTTISIYAHIGGWHIPAAGFILLSISQGLFVGAIGLKQGELNYSTGVAGIIFMIPSLVMICYYGIFPWWLRIFSLLTVIPFIFLLVEIFNGTYKQDSFSENILYSIYSISTLGWAYYIWKDYMKSNSGILQESKRESEILN